MSKSKSSIWEAFVSTRTMATLLIIFAVAIGAATFIEDAYDTPAAQRIIYHALWFKMVMVLLCINFFGNIKRYRLLKKEKLSILAIHIGLILTIVGAAVTHYIGFEGIIRTREGEVVSYMWSAEPYFEIKTIDEASGQMYKHPMLMNPSECPLLSNHFEIEIDPFKKGKSTFEYVDYQSKVTLGPPVDNSEEGIDCLEMVFEGMISEYIPAGGYIEKQGIAITYNYPQPDAINITGEGDDLQIEFPADVNRLSMETQTMDTLLAGKHTLQKRHLHSIGNLSLVFKGFHPKMDRPLVKDDNGQDLLTVKVSHNGESKNISLWGGKGAVPNAAPYIVGGETFYLKFGAIKMDLPFALRLDDFVLETYPGSDRHSGYRSEVTVYEKGENPVNTGESHSIYMNNVLDYEGYRVFQSSYDKIDGVEVSVFSVNHDFWGTWISYTAYILLGLGFMVTLFNRNSRFRELGKRLVKMNKTRSVVSALLLMFMSSSFIAQENKYKPVSQEHADVFNKMLVVSYTGRIEPCNSLAYDLIRKLTRKDNWTINSTGDKLSAEQFMLDLFIEPGFWAKQPILKFDNRTGLGKELGGIEGNFLAFTDIMEIKSENGDQYIEPKIFLKKDAQGNDLYYTFDSLVNWAEMKALSNRNTFDKEVIKLNEKVSIFWQATQGNLLRIIPFKTESEIKWLNWFDPEADFDLSQGNAGKDVVVTPSNLIRSYLGELINGKQTGDYTNANFMVEKIIEYQRQVYVKNPRDLPTAQLVDLEISYNKANVFNRLKYLYALLGLLLIPLTLMAQLAEKPKRWVKWFINGLAVIFLLCFLGHTINLGLRWYIIGHAPWSDGYEALTFIAWGAVLSGLIFYRISQVAMAATALLAFFILMTAGHSKYDPQMSQLEPVLKSYWLVIHVACLTISYSFFGLGFILSLINMGLFSSASVHNKKRTGNLIKELTYVNEMTLTIGLTLATIGTFLGGVWANESWGRYWGWDAKETWALVIVLVYAFVLHMRFVPGLRGAYALNLASAIGFGSVIMTFVGVNYYLTKGLHSYARGDAPAFAWWVWLILFGLIGLFIIAGIKQKKIKA